MEKLKYCKNMFVFMFMFKFMLIFKHFFSEIGYSSLIMIFVEAMNIQTEFYGLVIGPEGSGLL